MVKSGDLLEMSDDDFLKINPTEVEQTPPVIIEETTATETVVEEEPEKVPSSGSETEDDLAAETEAEKAARLADEGENQEEKPDNEKDKNKQEIDTNKGKKEEDPKDTNKTVAKPADANADKNKTESNKEVTYTPEAFYAEVMKPFKANGKEIKINTPEEAIRLMQMGAGYGRKLQDMQPHLKTMRMLEKNNLLDEGKLSFLIDINNKNPEAIKQLIKDSGIDPLDINTEDNTGYVQSNHSIDDTTYNFEETLRDVGSRPSGIEVIKFVNENFDLESKEALWKSPELLRVIESQKENGIFDTITAEIDRRKLLGYIPAGTPYMKAYKDVGDELYKKPATPSAPVPKPAKQALETRTVVPKPVVANNDKARAALPTQTSGRKAKETVNPLDMADDDFLKQFNGRL